MDLPFREAPCIHAAWQQHIGGNGTSQIMLLRVKARFPRVRAGSLHREKISTNASLDVTKVTSVGQKQVEIDKHLAKAKIRSWPSPAVLCESAISFMNSFIYSWWINPHNQHNRWSKILLKIMIRFPQKEKGRNGRFLTTLELSHVPRVRGLREEWGTVCLLKYLLSIWQEGKQLWKSTESMKRVL